MKYILLIFISFLSITGFSQAKKKPDVPVVPAAKDSVLTMDTKFISLNDLLKQADRLKDSVNARQYESFYLLFNNVINGIITEQQKKNK